MKEQKTGNDRGKETQEGVWNNISDPVVLTAAPFRVWDAIKQLHPYKKEILNLVRVLNRIGVNSNIIAAALSLQRWKTFYGNWEWTEEDVKALLEGYRA